ncbi:MAG: thiamine-phosphate kinase [Chitinispirillaceae bacterium]|jgi:thiamine-monophosphate kinase
MSYKNYPSGEYKLLEELKKILGPAAAPGGRYELTLGDDAAIRRSVRGERMVLTADISVEGVHFTPDIMTFEEIGFRTMAANVSDCAAMAALPEAALVQLVFPRKARNLQKNIIALYRGFAEACRKWNFKLIGGDLSGGAVWTIGITILGIAPASGRLLKRTGARTGDVLWLSGFPGRSAAGLAVLQKWGRGSVPKRYRGLVETHIKPDPPVKFGVILGRCKKVHAMMDLSDGISKDVRTLCFENRLGVELSLDNLNVPHEMLELSRELGKPWQEWALHGGEEYELLFATSKTFSPENVPKEFRRGLIRLGVFTDKHRVMLLLESGKIKKIPKKGWDHIAEITNNNN